MENSTERSTLLGTSNGYDQYNTNNYDKNSNNNNKNNNMDDNANGCCTTNHRTTTMTTTSNCCDNDNKTKTTTTTTTATKTIGLLGSLAIAVNSLAGPAILQLPFQYQQSGIIPTSLCLMFVAVLSAFCSLHMANTISK